MFLTGGNAIMVTYYGMKITTIGSLMAGHYHYNYDYLLNSGGLLLQQSKAVVKGLETVASHLI